jgi:hypothetical protein
VGSQPRLTNILGWTGTDLDGRRAEIVYEWMGSAASGTQVRAGSTDNALDSKDGGWKVKGTGGDFEKCC